MKFTEPQMEAVAEAARVLWPKAISDDVRDLMAVVPDILAEAGLMIVPETHSVRGEGEPNLKPGQVWTREDSSRWLRVRVIAGRGGFAFWHRTQPSGKEANWDVIADLNDNKQASHRAGRFTETFEGKPGTLAWLEVKSSAEIRG